MKFLSFLKKLVVFSLFVPYNLTINPTPTSNDTGRDFYLSSSYNVYRQLDTCSAFYFSNLSTNFGYNHYGTCGFVALASLLSYYDTY